MKKTASCFCAMLALFGLLCGCVQTGVTESPTVSVEPSIMPSTEISPNVEESPDATDGGVVTETPETSPTS